MAAPRAAAWAAWVAWTSKFHHLRFCARKNPASAGFFFGLRSSAPSWPALGHHWRMSGSAALRPDGPAPREDCMTSSKERPRNQWLARHWHHLQRHPRFSLCAGLFVLLAAALIALGVKPDR